MSSIESSDGNTTLKTVRDDCGGMFISVCVCVCVKDEKVIDLTYM